MRADSLATRALCEVAAAALAFKSRGEARVSLDQGAGHVALRVEDATEQGARNRSADAFVHLGSTALAREDLAEITARLVGGWGVQLAGGPARAEWLAELSVSGIEVVPDVLARWRAALESVTPERLRDFAAEQLAEPVHVLVVPGGEG